MLKCVLNAITHIISHAIHILVQVELVKALRTLPKGVDLMYKYPDISIDPGVSPWADGEKWKSSRVFEDHLDRWTYTNLASTQHLPR